MCVSQMEFQENSNLEINLSLAEVWPKTISKSYDCLMHFLKYAKTGINHTSC